MNYFADKINSLQTEIEKLMQEKDKFTALEDDLNQLLYRIQSFKQAIALIGGEAEHKALDCLREAIGISEALPLMNQIEVEQERAIAELKEELQDVSQISAEQERAIAILNQDLEASLILRGNLEHRLIELEQLLSEKEARIDWLEKPVGTVIAERLEEFNKQEKLKKQEILLQTDTVAEEVEADTQYEQDLSDRPEEFVDSLKEAVVILTKEFEQKPELKEVLDKQAKAREFVEDDLVSTPEGLVGRVCFCSWINGKQLLTVALPPGKGSPNYHASSLTYVGKYTPEPRPERPKTEDDIKAIAKQLLKLTSWSEIRDLCRDCPEALERAIVGKGKKNLAFVEMLPGAIADEINSSSSQEALDWLPESLRSQLESLLKSPF